MTNSNQKIIFFDIDGTLITGKNIHTFTIPPKTLEALKKLKENGHLIAISSGRQGVFIHKLFPGMFDSYVALNGAHVVFQGECLRKAAYTTEQVKDAIRYFDRFDCRYAFVGWDQAWTHSVEADKIPALNDAYGLDGYVLTDWEPEDVVAGGMDFFFENEEHFQQCSPAFKPPMVLNVHGFGIGGDLSVQGQDKSLGIRILLERAGIPLENAYAFGDGLNDITMLRTVGHGIAMGNAHEETKRAAEYVTSSILEDGIYHGLAHYQLL